MDEQKQRKRTMDEIIHKAAEEGARKVLKIQRKEADTNHYRAMEDLLRAYKNTKRWEDHPEEYGFFPVEKSHDISVAPPPGLGLRDKVETTELFVQSKETSFIRSMARFFELDAVVKLFEKRREFIVIRMYYFGENEYGEDRGPDAKPYTFPQITEALLNIGIDRSEKALRRWRSKLVQEMTVMMFGVDGALSIESRAQNSKKGQGDSHAAEVEDAEGQVRPEDQE